MIETPMLIFTNSDGITLFAILKTTPGSLLQDRSKRLDGSIHLLLIFC